jgi:hypothetical protein
MKPVALEREEFQELSLRFLDDDDGNIQTRPPSLFISRAKLVFGSASYSKLVSQTHDVFHCQAQKLSFHQKTMFSQIIFSFTRKNLLPTHFCFITLLELSCLSVT